jgi:mannose-1-phosphate guanylyltransferase
VGIVGCVTSVRAAMILGAGLGTRLRPLTDWIAKPMVPVGDAPCVAHVAQRIRATLAPSRMVVNVHHRPFDLEGWAATADVRVSHEPELLGTAGGIAKARELLGDGDVLVWNGDVLSDLDAGALAAAHSGEATLAILRRPAGEGNVGMDAGGRIVRLRSSQFGEESSGGEFLGIHIVGAALRDALVPKGCIVGDVYIPALARGARLSAFTVEASFVDVGSLAQYRAANRAWLGDRMSWSHPSARVASSIEGSVVGKDAVVDAPAIRSVVWPGTHVRTPIENAIATPFGVV